MKRWIWAVSVVAIVMAVWAGAASADTIILKSKDGLGKYISDAKGMTLYYFKTDSPGKSTCVGGCLEKWPLFYSDKIVVAKDLKAEDFGSISREDGKKQTTYKGYPLYYFAGDKNPGDTNGQAVKNVWFVVDPSTFKQ